MTDIITDLKDQRKEELRILNEYFGEHQTYKFSRGDKGAMTDKSA